MKNELEKYKGVVVPMVSPFDGEYSIDEAAVRRIIESFVENKVKPLILGTTGEVASLSSEQKEKLVEVAVREMDGRQPLIAGLCGNSISELINDGKKYADLGVDALVALAPNYYPIKDNQAEKWFSQLADNLTVPMFIYNIPATTHYSISLDVIEVLSHHHNIIGIKDSQPDLSRLDESLERWSKRDDFLFLVGCAANSAHGLKKGADGIVPSVGNLFPHLYQGLYEATLKGDLRELDRLQELTNKISAYNQAGRTVTEAIPALKLLMSVKGLCEPHVLPPMCRGNAGEERAYLKEISDKILNIED